MPLRASPCSGTLLGSLLWVCGPRSARGGPEIEKPGGGTVATTDSRPETQTGLLRNSKAVALTPDHWGPRAEAEVMKGRKHASDRQE